MAVTNSSLRQQDGKAALGSRVEAKGQGQQTSPRKLQGEGMVQAMSSESQQAQLTDSRSPCEDSLGPTQ